MPIIQKEKKQWFDYPDEEYPGRALIRLPKAGELRAIREKTQEVATYQPKKTFGFDDQAPETVFRQRGYREEVACVTVKAWDGFLDEDGKPMECTRANILRMCLEAGFLDFVDGCLKQMEPVAQKEAQEEEKN